MAQLPKRFPSWLKFLASIQRHGLLSKDVETIIVGNETFTVNEIKAHCFDELMLLIPAKDKLFHCTRELAFNRLPIEDVDWLFSLFRAL